MTTEGPVKGIMLAERPKASTSSSAAFVPASGAASNEPWGLTPVKKVNVAEVLEKPPGINVHHRHWIKQLDKTMKTVRQGAEQAALSAKEQEEAIAQFSEKLRTAILNGEDVSFWKHARKPSRSPAAFDPAASQTGATPTATSTSQQQQSSSSVAVPTDEEIRRFVEDVYQEALAVASPSKPAATKAAGVEPSTSSAAKGAAAAQDTPGTGAGASGSGKAEAEQAAGSSSGTKPGTSTSGKVRPATPSKSSKAAAAKPAWALSSSEAEQVSAAEEEELLSFAQGLDFDAYLGELDDKEVEGALAALQEAEAAQAAGDDKGWRKNFVRAMNHVALKRAQAAAASKLRGDDDDGASVAGLSEGGVSNVTKSTLASRAKAEAAAARLAALSAAGDKEDRGWDASTRAGDDVGRMAGAAKSADEFLRENPDLKGVHSLHSVRAQLAKQEERLATPDKALKAPAAAATATATATSPAPAAAS